MNAQNRKTLESLFVELVNCELSKFKIVSENMLNNIIQYFAEIKPFNTISLDEWGLIYSNSNDKIKA